VERHKTVLMVTHDLDLAGHAGRVVRLSDGLIVQDEASAQEGAGAVAA
jgi:ABC-type lipoprotein export system ATPase subunit